MSKRPDTMHIKPAIVDVGRGPEPAVLEFRRQGKWWRLPFKGATVPAKGPEGRHWKARVSEGSAVPAGSVTIKIEE
jgi:hypothetical protein